MKDLLDFLDTHMGWIFLFVLFFGGSVAAFVNRTLANRTRRLLQEAKYRRDVEIVVERRKIAEATNDAIKLLLVDDQLARDFDRRLRVAISTGTPPPQLDEEVEEEPGRDEKGRFLPRKARA